MNEHQLTVQSGVGLGFVVNFTNLNHKMASNSALKFSVILITKSVGRSYSQRMNGTSLGVIDIERFQMRSLFINDFEQSFQT